jgi:hypothetical protein
MKVNLLSFENYVKFVCSDSGLSHADDNALGEVPVSKTANEVAEERNKGFLV